MYRLCETYDYQTVQRDKPTENALSVQNRDWEETLEVLPILTPLAAEQAAELQCNKSSKAIIQSEELYKFDYSGVLVFLSDPIQGYINFSQSI